MVKITASLSEFIPHSLLQFFLKGTNFENCNHSKCSDVSSTGNITLYWIPGSYTRFSLGINVVLCGWCLRYGECNPYQQRRPSWVFCKITFSVQLYSGRSVSHIFLRGNLHERYFTEHHWTITLLSSTVNFRPCFGWSSGGLVRKICW